MSQQSELEDLRNIVEAISKAPADRNLGTYQSNAIKVWDKYHKPKDPLFDTFRKIAWDYGVAQTSVEDCYKELKESGVFTMAIDEAIEKFGEEDFPKEPVSWFIIKHLKEIRTKFSKGGVG